MQCYEKTLECPAFMHLIFYLRTKLQNMKFQPGDKVKFLNEKGGGIVKRIIDSATVEVAIEEGFDLPVRITDLIIVATQDASARLFDVDYPKSRSSMPVSQEEIVSKEAPARSFIARDLDEGIYFAIKPHDQKMLIAGYVDIILVNHSSFDVLYSVFQKSPHGFRGMDYGSIGPGSFVLMDTCDRKSLDDWMDAVVQIMFHAEQSDTLIKAMDLSIRIKTGKMLREDSYIKTPFMPGHIFALPLYLLPKEGVENTAKPQALKALPDTSLIEKHRIDAGFAEVDLHIQALVEQVSGLDPSQIMNIQLDYLKRALESAIAASYEKVVFIHGVGAGVLKIEVKKLLEQYDFVEYYDASIAKYGIGATEVLIHRKRN